MISSLKQKQQQKKLRQELRTRIRDNSRIDGEQLFFDGQSIDRGYLNRERHSRRGCYQPKEEKVTQKRSKTDR